MATIVQRLLALRNELDSILLDLTSASPPDHMILDIKQTLERGEQVELGPSPASPKSYYEFYKVTPNAPKKIKITRPKEDLDSVKESGKAVSKAIETEPDTKKVSVSKKVLKRTDNEIVKNRLQAEKDAIDAFKKV